MHTWIPCTSKVPRSYAVSGIYAFRHIATGRYYVGSSINCRTRFWLHIGELTRGDHFSARLRRTWAKYGAASFEMTILELVPQIENLIPREQYWIDHLRSYLDGFNLRPRAEANYGIQWTADQNDRRQKANVLTWADPTRRAQLGKRFKGQKRGEWSAESHKKASEALRKMHAEKPEWRVAIRSALALNEVEQRRLEGVRESLKRPDVYKRRCAQLRLAAKSPKMAISRREYVVKRLNLAHKGINSSSELDTHLVSLYAAGHSLRSISRQVGIDHKSIAERLRRQGLTIEKRFARGEQRKHRLTASDVREIQGRLAKKEPQATIAKRYGVSSSVICEINCGKAWKHLK